MCIGGPLKDRGAHLIDMINIPVIQLVHLGTSSLCLVQLKAHRLFRIT